MVSKNDSIFKYLDEITYPNRDAMQKNFFHVFVYASGKTGSTSLHKSFYEYGLSSMHTHSSKYFEERVIREKLGDHFILMDYINHLAKKAKNTLLIIDIVREPISRKISSFFQSMTTYLEFPTNLPKNMAKFQGFPLDKLLEHFSDNIGEMIELFNNDYLLKRENYYSFDEYDRDGVSIRSRNFDFSNNRMFFLHNSKRYLILRFEDINMWEGIIQSIGYPNFRLVEENLTEKKKISKLNNQFKEHYKIPKTTLDYIYLNEKMHAEVLAIFYTQEEQENYYNYWLEKSY